MQLKVRANHALYIQTLRRMTPAQRLAKAFELSVFAKGLFLAGLRKRFPDLPAAQFQQLMLDRLERCHNRNY